MKDIKKLVLTALFAALACVATMAIRIPTPGTGGYIHPGDAIVILSGVFLGPVYGFLAAGIGSAMSDLIGGYFIYVPITFVVKGLIGLGSGLIFKHMNTSVKKRYLAVGLGGVLDAFLVVFGYGACETIMYGFAGALASALPNLVQGIGGLVLAMILYPAVTAVPEMRRMSLAK
ncbi:MAG: ECF transporter S component [Lachnospiraceae bacterium]|nr:ECF transporter S component [Lachnospiraceae bacterium]